MSTEEIKGSELAVSAFGVDALETFEEAKIRKAIEEAVNGKSDIKSAVIELFPKILESIWKKLPNNVDKIEFKIK